MNSLNHSKGEEGEKRVAKRFAMAGLKVLHVGGAVRYSMDGARFMCADLLPYGERQTFWVQVKNKEPRTNYPDTGLELWRFKQLWKLQTESGLPVLLVFTDNSLRIYGDWISNLSVNNERHGNTWNEKDNCQMVYFWLSKLRPVENIIRNRREEIQLLEYMKEIHYQRIH